MMLPPATRVVSVAGRPRAIMLDGYLCPDLSVLAMLAAGATV